MEYRQPRRIQYYRLGAIDTIDTIDTTATAKCKIRVGVETHHHANMG